jgi:hypothetical protein
MKENVIYSCKTSSGNNVFDYNVSNNIYTDPIRLDILFLAAAAMAMVMAAVMGMAAMTAVMTAMASMKMKMRMTAVGMLMVEMVVVGVAVVVVEIAGMKMAETLAAQAALVVLVKARLVQSMACLVVPAVTIRMTA